VRGMSKYTISLIIKEIRAIRKLLLDIKRYLEQRNEQKLVLLDFSDIEFKTEQDKIKFLKKLEAFTKYLDGEKTKKVDFKKIGKELGNELIQMIDKEIKR